MLRNSQAASLMWHGQDATDLPSLIREQRLLIEVLHLAVLDTGETDVRICLCRAYRLGMACRHSILFR
jgi:hypothetical protein